MTETNDFSDEFNSPARGMWFAPLPEATAPNVLGQVRGPYVGPRPFQGDDKAFFFGREREARELANMVAAR
jgi:hypothetical protein